MSDFQVFCFFS